MGAVIGHRGETLDALQYLAGLAANNTSGLNFGNYREKREQALNGLAAKVCEQVLRTGRSRALEPMNPYERRIIHTAVQGIDGVISESVGEGSSRRVVIAAEGTEIRDMRRDNHRPRGRGGRPSGSRPPSEQHRCDSSDPRAEKGHRSSALRKNQLTPQKAALRRIFRELPGDAERAAFVFARLRSADKCRKKASPRAIRHKFLLQIRRGYPL